ncbi:MAG TPA: helix-turn-helix transcriptional regulator [Thermoanaerobaculia bacterium]|nr:helix-turn-helix transcriptional regulator [Thermoanaerobaculia bacterium]
MEGLDPRIFGVALEKYRIRQDKLSQEELAQAAGLSLSTVGSILRGKRKLTHANFVKLCRALGIDVDEIYQDGCVVQLEEMREIEKRLRMERGESQARNPSRDELSNAKHSILSGLDTLLSRYIDVVEAPDRGRSATLGSSLSRKEEE